MTSKRMGQLVREARKAHRLTQPELAVSAGITTSYVSRIENGDRKPTREILLALAGALHMSLEETNNLLSSAAYASKNEEIRSYMNYSLAPATEDTTAIVSLPVPLSLLRTVQDVVEAIVDLADDDSMDANRKDIALVLLQTLPPWIREGKKLLLQLPTARSAPTGTKLPFAVQAGFTINTTLPNNQNNDPAYDLPRTNLRNPSRLERPPLIGRRHTSTLNSNNRRTNTMLEVDKAAYAILELQSDYLDGPPTDLYQ